MASHSTTATGSEEILPYSLPQPAKINIDDEALRSRLTNEPLRRFWECQVSLGCEKIVLNPLFDLVYSLDPLIR
jgi:hypothetical protein